MKEFIEEAYEYKGLAVFGLLLVLGCIATAIAIVT